MDPGDLTLDVAGDIILDADGGDILFKDGGTHGLPCTMNSYLPTEYGEFWRCLHIGQRL